MTFDEAKNKIAQIAAGRYHHLSYMLTIFSDKSEALCGLYIDSGIIVSARTWEFAFKALDEKLNPQPIEPPNPEEAPGEETFGMASNPGTM